MRIKRAAAGRRKIAPLVVDGRRMPKMCLVAHKAYAALAGHEGHIGGVEHQTTLMARWLAQHRWRVSVVTRGEGRPQDEIIDGVRVIKMCREDAGLPGVRFFHPRWSSLLLALRRAGADLYYQNCAEYVTGQVAMWCLRNGRAFVYSVASDPDCDRRLAKMRTLRERALYRYGLRNANQVIVQTGTQQRMLRSHFGIESMVLPMPCPGPIEGEFVPPSPRPPGRARVAWVGRIAPVKRLEWLLEVAAGLPGVAFDVVGPWDRYADYARAVLGRGRCLPNVTMYGPVVRESMRRIYREASVLCCTSHFEGFPNTFLEAWSHGVPVVTTFDPDHLVSERQLGVVAHDVPGLIVALRSLLCCPQWWLEVSCNARRYYLQNHTVDAAMRRFESVLVDVLRQQAFGAAAPSCSPAADPTGPGAVQAGGPPGEPLFLARPG